MRKYYHLQRAGQFHPQTLSYLEKSYCFLSFKDMEQQTTAERSCSIWTMSNHGWHPIFTARKPSSSYDELPPTPSPKYCMGTMWSKVGERFLPYNLNIIMLTFSSRTPSQMAASQITTPLLLFIAASQSLKGTITKTMAPRSKQKHSSFTLESFIYNHIYLTDELPI